MRAAWYERQGRASDVLVVDDVPDPDAGPGEVRIRVWASGINPGDLKKRGDAFGIGMPYPRVIPHSDGAGTIDAVGAGVAESRVGERVWCYGAQSYRPFGTAAEYVVVPAGQAVPLPDDVPYEQGACLGIPGITGYRAIEVAGPLDGRTVLVQGGAGAVGQCAIALARRAGASVIATVRSSADVPTALRAGAHTALDVSQPDGVAIVERIRESAPDGVDHIVEVAFDANIHIDDRVLAPGGSIAAYATRESEPSIPFWTLLFKNATLFLIGSDDVPKDSKQRAAEAVNDALRSGWPGYEIGARYPLDEIAAVHEALEAGRVQGRAVLRIMAPGVTPEARRNAAPVP